MSLADTLPNFQLRHHIRSMERTQDQMLTLLREAAPFLRNDAVLWLDGRWHSVRDISVKVDALLATFSPNAQGQPAEGSAAPHVLGASGTEEK
jgi:mRNA-degrading endonuclease YafQ of YafQ-DinJ toxin-antitoxin module